MNNRKHKRKLMPRLIFRMVRYYDMGYYRIIVPAKVTVIGRNGELPRLNKL